MPLKTTLIIGSVVMKLEDKPAEDRMERKKKETRRKIVAAAIELFQRQGFNNTTMEQIAIKADIARKTLYNYFPAKEAIVHEYVRDKFRGLEQNSLELLEVLPDTRSRLLASLNKVYEWITINPEITGIFLGSRMKELHRGSGDNSDEIGANSTVAEIIRLGQQAGEIRRDVSVELLAKQIYILFGVVVLDWLNAPVKFEPRQEITRIIDLFLYGSLERAVSQ